MPNSALTIPPSTAGGPRLYDEAKYQATLATQQQRAGLACEFRKGSTEQRGAAALDMATCEVDIVSPRRFAVKLRQIRERKGITQKALAVKAGVSRAYLSRLEMGRHDPPLSRLRTLAAALKVKVSELVD